MGQRPYEGQSPICSLTERRGKPRRTSGGRAEVSCFTFDDRLARVQLRQLPRNVIRNVVAGLVESVANEVFDGHSFLQKPPHLAGGISQYLYLVFINNVTRRFTLDHTHKDSSLIQYRDHLPG